MTSVDKLVDEFFTPILNKSDTLEELREGIILKKGCFYFDWTGSGLAHNLIEKRIKKLLLYYANTHSEASINAKIMSKVYLKSKKILAKSLNLNDEFAIISTGNGATGAIKKFQEIIGVYIPPMTKQNFISNINPSSLKKVFIGPYEHHSNEISWREGLCEVERIPLSKEGLLDLDIFKQKIQKAPKNSIISFNIASNVTGIISDYKIISELCKKNSLLLAYDMASSSAYINIDSNFDACFLSPHKLLGGVGTNGILCIKKHLIQTDLPPSFSGGGVVKYVNRKTQEYFQDPEIREEAGTPGIIQMYKIALAYMLRNEYGLDFIKRREHVLTQTFIHELSNIPAVKIYGNLQTHRLGIISFNIGGISPYELSYMLSSLFHIETRAGCSCAGPYGHDLLELQDSSSSSFPTKPGWVRISIHYTHSLNDIEYLIDSIKKCVKKLR